MWERDFIIDGRRLHARLDGPAKGRPSYLLETGAGVSCAFWSHVQRRLAVDALTLSYDRAGYGDSDAVAREPLSAQTGRVMSDLTALIRQAGPPSPLVLVGHSSGALWARLYAARNPDVVSALVLIDPTPLVLPEWITGLFDWTTGLVRFLASLADLGLLTAFNPFTRLGALPRDDARALSRALAGGPHLRATAAELDGLAGLQAAVAASPLSPDLPVLVISAGDWRKRASRKGSKPNLASNLLAEHEALARASHAGRHLVIDGANHMDLVADDRFAAPVAAAIQSFSASLGR